MPNFPALPILAQVPAFALIVHAATFLALCPPVLAQATSFSVYTPKSGLRKFDASVGAEVAIASRWKLQANVGFTRLGDDAAASPLVGRRNGASVAQAVAYAF